MVSNQSVSDTPEGTSGTTQKEENRDSVSYETHKRLLKQRKEDQDRLRTVEEELSKFKTEAEKKQQSELEQQGEWKKLIDVQKQKIQQLEESIGSDRKTLHDTWKLQAFYDKLPGKIKRKEYLSFVDLEKVALNPETQEIDETSLEVLVNDFVSNHKDLIITEQSPKIPGTAPKTTIPTTYKEEISRCTTQKEFDEVRKKYNRT